MTSKDGLKRTPLGKPGGVGGVDGKLPYGQLSEALGLITCRGPYGLAPSKSCPTGVPGTREDAIRPRIELGKSLSGLKGPKNDE